MLSAGSLIWRIYYRGGPFPGDWFAFRAFGPVPTARFDHHLPPAHQQDRAILYAAVDGLTCLAEVFQRQRVIDRRGGRPWLVAFVLRRETTLLRLDGLWPTAAGASMALCSGPRPRAQRWSRAIYDAYPAIEGLWYPSSMAGNAPAIALYERAKDALPSQPRFHRPLDDPALLTPLRRVARRLHYALV
jgi:hypothetical protein